MKRTVIVLLSILLLVMLILRMGVTYLSGEHLRMPEQYVAHWGKVGGDWQSGFMNWAYDFRDGASIRTEKSYYGLGFSAILATTIPLLCPFASDSACTRTYYGLLLAASLLSFVALMIKASPTQEDKIIGLLAFAVFLLGIPGAHGIGAGNIDILMAPVAGLLFLFTPRKRPNRVTIAVLGFLWGALVNIKIFLVPLALVWIVATGNVFTVIGMILGYLTIAATPLLYGVSLPIFAPIASGLTANEGFLSQGFTYSPGNNTLFGMASTARELISRMGDSDIGQIIGFTAAWIAGFTFLYIAPVARECSVKLLKKVVAKPGSWKTGALFLGLPLAISAITMLPTLSYDYRLYYSFVGALVLLRFAKNIQARQYCYAALILLLVNSLWIEHARIMSIFLYFHFYCLIRGGWLETVS